MSDRIRRRKPTTSDPQAGVSRSLGTDRKVGDHLGCDLKVVNRIVNGRCAVTAEDGAELGAAFLDVS